MSRLDRITDWGALSERAGYRVGTLADRVGVTERQLRRYFRAKFGQSPHSWMAESRLQGVRELLAEGNPVKVVAIKAGYSQQGNLARQFKQYYHVSPSSIRSPQNAR
jgi:AraC family transcriptional regulator